MEDQWKIEKTNTDKQDLTLSVISVSSKKIPYKSWEMYKSNIAPVSEWYQHYCNNGTVGIITGKVSGNLEIIDVDVKNDPDKSIMNELIELIPPPLFKRLIVQTTPNEGFHLIYRCNEMPIEGNQKLALHSNGAVIIETRGEGGYFCTSILDYKVIQGKMNLKEMTFDIPYITKNERDFLLECSRSLTRYFPQHSKESSKNTSDFVYKESAINEFNKTYNILDLFTKHGWSKVNEDDQKYFLKRPDAGSLHSGYYFKETRTFFCFSSSTDFKPQKPHNNFQILQVLEGKNDYNKTLRLLPNFGYSIGENKDKVTLDDISSFLNNSGVAYDTFIQDLTLNGNIIEEIDYNTLFIDLKEHYGKHIPRTRYEEIIKSRYTTQVNPVLNFIKEHEHIRPEGTFEKWLDCITLENKSIEKSVVLHFLKKWYVGMIAQSLNGQYPNEFFLCLLSTEQGVGKSSLLKNSTLPYPSDQSILLSWI